METQCFAPVRGSALRATGLTERGDIPETVRYATSKSVARINIREVVDAGNAEMIANPEEERRLKIVRPARTIRNTVDIEFLRVDPGMLSLVAGMALVYGDGAGFGEVPFGLAPFGTIDPATPVVGFDAIGRITPTAFALEVWSKLAGAVCADGTRKWGYTLFPYLKGGRITGFSFANGLVSFNLVGAQTRRMPRWGVGPYDLEGEFQRLTSPVSRNTHYRMFVTTAQPPVEQCGIFEFVDVIGNGTPSNPMPYPEAPLVLNGGTPADAGPWIIEGGRP